MTWRGPRARRWGGPRQGPAPGSGLLGPERNPGNTTFVAGTDGPDSFGDQPGPGATIICRFGSNDVVGTLGAGVTFLGGAGDDVVVDQDGGTFNGGDGNDVVLGRLTGVPVAAGDGNARVIDQSGGYFNGGAGADTVGTQSGGTFRD